MCKLYLGVMMMVLCTTIDMTASPLEPPLRVEVDSLALDRLLMRIGRTQETVSYSGVQSRTFALGEREVELLWREHHWQPDQTVITLLAPEELAGAQFVRQGTEVRQLVDEQKQRDFPYRYRPKSLLRNGRIFKEISLLRQNYTVKAERGPLHLGRPTIAVKVQPKVNGRPALEALVDKQTSLVLQSKRILNGSNGRLTEDVTRFLEISYGEPDSAVFTESWASAQETGRKRRSKTYANLQAVISENTGMLLKPDRVPAGFALLRMRSIERKNKSFLHFLYGDGLTFVSLFQYKAGKPNHENSKEPSDAAQRKSERGEGPWQIVRGTQAGTSYGIAGEIPRAELEVMAASLKPIASPARSWRNVPLYVATVLILISFITYASRRKREKMYA